MSEEQSSPGGVEQPDIVCDTPRPKTAFAKKWNVFWTGIPYTSVLETAAEDRKDDKK